MNKPLALFLLLAVGSALSGGAARRYDSLEHRQDRAAARSNRWLPI